MNKLSKIFCKNDATPKVKSDKELLVELSGHALCGMVASKEWMDLAKEECRKPSHGDVPNFFAECALLYAQRTLDKINERHKQVEK